MLNESSKRQERGGGRRIKVQTRTAEVRKNRGHLATQDSQVRTEEMLSGAKNPKTFTKQGPLVREKRLIWCKRSKESHKREEASWRVEGSQRVHR